MESLVMATSAHVPEWIEPGYARSSSAADTENESAGQKTKIFRPQNAFLPFPDALNDPSNPRRRSVIEGYSPNARKYWFANRPGLENPYRAAISVTDADPSERAIA